MRTYWVFFVIFWIISASKCGQTRETAGCFEPNAPLVNEQEISDRFFKPYGSWERPRLNASQPVVDEKAGTMTVTGYLFMNWTDEFRKWNHSFPHNCINYLIVSGSEMWLPDVGQHNSNDRYSMIRRKDEFVRIYQNGSASFSPGGSFEIFCQFDLTLFPFDTQTCNFELIAWKTTTEHLLYGRVDLFTLDFIHNEQWRLIEATLMSEHFKSLAPTHYAHVVYTFTVKRKAAYFVMDVIYPSLLLGIAFLATFFLHLGSIEKLSISFTCLLAYSVFQSIVTDHMPKSSDNIPLLLIYLNLQMSFISFSMLGQGLSLVALDESRKRPSEQCKVPRCLAKMLVRIGCCMGIKDPGVLGKGNGSEINSSSNSEVLSDVPVNGSNVTIVSTVEEPHKASSDYTSEWVLVSRLIGRTVAISYVICISVTAFLIFVVIPNAFVSFAGPDTLPLQYQHTTKNKT